MRAGAGGNNISFTGASLHTDLDNVVERLEKIVESTSKCKKLANAVSAKEMTDLQKFAPESNGFGRQTDLTVSF